MTSPAAIRPRERPRRVREGRITVRIETWPELIDALLTLRYDPVTGRYLGAA